MPDILTTAKEYYAAFNRKDWTAMLALIHDDIRHEPNQGDEVRIGKALFADFLVKMNDAYDENLTEMYFFSEPQSERIAVEFVVNGIYKKAEEGLPEARNQTYELPAAAFLAFQDGKISRVTTYYNLPLWIKLVQI